MSDEEEGGRLSSGGNTYERIVQIVTALIAIAFISVIYIYLNKFHKPTTGYRNKMVQISGGKCSPYLARYGLYRSYMCVAVF